jgi:hypothetical protein
MRTLRRMTATAIVILSALFCLAQLSTKRPAAICDRCDQETAATITDAEDFSFIGLLTMKFM